MAKLNFENLKVDNTDNYKFISIKKAYNDDKTFKMFIKVNKWHPSYFKFMYETISKEMKNYNIPVLLKPFYFIKALFAGLFRNFSEIK